MNKKRVFCSFLDLTPYLCNRKYFLLNKNFYYDKMQKL